MVPVRALVAMLILAGCSHSAVVVGNAQPVAPSGNVNASGSVAAAVLIITIAVAASQSESNPPPAAGMAPEREIADQDCTKPIDLAAGNLRCR